MGPFNLILLLSGFATVAYGLSHEEEEKCALLEKSIKDYVNGTRTYDNVLYYEIVRSNMIDSSDVYQIKEGSGIDITTATGVHTFACGLAAAKSRDDVTKLCGTESSFTDQLYAQVLAPVEAVGSLPKLLEVGSVILDMMKWVHRNGFPVLPMTIDEKDTMKTLTNVRDAMKNDYVRRYMEVLPLPLKVTPQEAVTLMKEADSYQELEEGLGVPSDSLQRWANWQQRFPSAVTDGITDVKVTIALLEALDKTGVLYLE